MRYIPPELLARVKSKFQVSGNNAEPKMKVLLSRGFTKELFTVFTPHNGDDLSKSDVTVRRLLNNTSPSRAFLAYIDNGLSKVKSKNLPYDDLLPWDYEMDVANNCWDVAIEFDGFWQRSTKTGRFDFITEEHPWIFYNQNGTLMARYWLDTPIELDTGVTKIASIRGWVPADGDTLNDQGLIVAYLKNNEMYYRNYCIQANGSKLWELSRKVNSFSGTIDNLGLFRTNDFRIGFLAEIAGNIWYVLTTRNYSGMSIRVENLKASISEIKVKVSKINYISSYVNENLNASIQSILINMLWGSPTYKALSITNEGPTIVKLQLYYPIIQTAKTDLEVVDGEDSRLSVSEVVLSNNNTLLTLTIDTLEYSLPGPVKLVIKGDGSTIGQANQIVTLNEYTFTPTGFEYIEPIPPSVEVIYNE